MSYIVTLENFTPVPRFDSTAFTSARIEQSADGPTGPWTTVTTVTLSPVDADPSAPQARDFTVSVAAPRAWYRVVWLDASGGRSDSGATYDDQSSYQAGGIPFGTLTTRLIAATGLAPTEAKARLNAAHKDFVARSEWLKAKVTIGETINGTAEYPLDPDIVQLLKLRVGGYSYDRKATDELEDLQVSDGYVVGRYRGFFAPEFTPGGSGEVLIFPTPIQDGVAITARAIMLPPDLVNDSDYPVIPADFHEDLIDAGMVTSIRRDDERFGDADALEARLALRIRELRGRGKRRVGGGTARVKLVT